MNENIINNINENEKLDLQLVYANLDQYLINAQNEFEYIIKKYCEAREYYTNCLIEYEIAFAESIKKLQQENKVPITILKEMAKLDCKDKYEKLLKAEEIYKKFISYKEAWQERINTIKFLGRIKFNISI